MKQRQPGLIGREFDDRAPVANAQSFSAELVTTREGYGADARRGHVAVHAGQVRIETPDLPDGFFLVDTNRNTAWFLRPQQRLYMDAKQSSPLTQVFLPVDEATACKRWEVMEHIAEAVPGDGEWRCERMGAEVIDGRTTVRYRVVTRQHRQSDRWIDPQRGFTVRFQGADGTKVDVANIVEGAQGASLFVLPPDYYKFDPIQLIELIKRSDVWVEPPR
jgi:hypothetical protein